ncbi:MAG TPA: nuclear transport factor 2 family protein [Rhizomicrobium sp.]|nr:nuclear transport factor 2 family protein [Rhizomicrobium sp.]
MPAREANFAAITRYVVAWARGDLPGIVACYHDDFTLHYFGNNPLSGTHAGKVVAMGVLREVSLKTNRKLVEIVDVMAGSNRAAVLVREAFSRDGRTAEVERLLVYSIKNSLLHECWVYDADQALVDEFLA